MVDTVILHASVDAPAAYALRDALDGRVAVTCEIKPNSPALMFGAQVLRIGLASGDLSVQETKNDIIALCEKSDGRGIVLSDEPGATIVSASNCIVITRSDDAFACADRIRDAIAQLDERSGLTKKRGRAKTLREPDAAQAKVAQRPAKAPAPAITPPSVPAPERRVEIGQPVNVSPVAEAVIVELERPIPQAPLHSFKAQLRPLHSIQSGLDRVELAPKKEPHQKTTKAPEVLHDPDKASKAKRSGLVVGIVLGVVAAGAIAGFYVQTRQAALARAPDGVSQLAPEGAVETAVIPLEPSVQQAPAEPPAAAMAPLAEPPELPELRGTLDAPNPPSVPSGAGANEPAANSAAPTASP